MQFAYTILYVKDVAATLNFYEQALGFTIKMITEEQDYGELESGGTTLAFAAHDLSKSNLPDGFLESSLLAMPFGMELAFTTETLVEDFKRAVEAGAMEVQPIQTKPWGQDVGYLRDPNGFLIELCTPMKAGKEEA